MRACRPRSAGSSWTRIVGARRRGAIPTRRSRYGADALKTRPPAGPRRAARPRPQTCRAVARALPRQRGCRSSPRGAGTGYTGGAVPLRGGVVLSLERLNRILEIDERNLLAVVEPNVITGDLQDAVERVGLFYPPDPASLRESAIGGNVAECAGGPRAFKYGTTKRYVLGLEAVLPTGEVDPHRAQDREERRRLRPDAAAGRIRGHARDRHADHAAAGPDAARTASTPARDVRQHRAGAVDAVDRAGARAGRAGGARARSIGRVARRGGCAISAASALAPDGTGRCSSSRSTGSSGRGRREPSGVERRLPRRRAPSRCCGRATRPSARSCGACGASCRYALKTVGAPEVSTTTSWCRRDACRSCSRWWSGCAGDTGLLIAVLRPRRRRQHPRQHHGGPRPTPRRTSRVKAAERALFEGVVALEGSISGEHGIGFSKAPYLALECHPTTIALMKRVKHAFDPARHPESGKIFLE